MEQNIVIKGTPQKNRAAIITIIVGVLLVLIGVKIADFFYNHESFWGNYYDSTYETIRYGRLTYSEGMSFGQFLFDEYFEDDFIGYAIALCLSVLVPIVGIVMKFVTEKCEITVTNEAVFGKLSRREVVYIPLNQITAVNRISFNGVSIRSIGKVSNFYCFENREEVMKALSYLLVNP